MRGSTPARTAHFSADQRTRPTVLLGSASTSRRTALSDVRTALTRGPLDNALSLESLKVRQRSCDRLSQATMITNHQFVSTLSDARERMLSASAHVRLSLRNFSASQSLTALQPWRHSS